jgi:3-methyladenine DNA glycosylase AlkD
MSLKSIRQDLRKLASPEKAKISQRFFKTGKGQYGEGDVFLGITVPQSRKIAKKYYKLSFKETKQLLESKIHEERLIAILILVHLYQTNEKLREDIVNFYLFHTTKINNWDLVDLSAHKILGAYLLDKDRKVLYKLAKSKNLWEKRIAIISTFHFIKNNQFKDTLKISEILLNDSHDLIHKAVGWMLREVGKKDLEVEEKFLKKHYKKMPRTMLRYAIERFEERKRLKYLRKEI